MTQRHHAVTPQVTRARAAAATGLVSAVVVGLAAIVLAGAAQSLYVALGAAALVTQTAIALAYWTTVVGRLAQLSARPAPRSRILLLYAIGTLALLLYPLLLALTFISPPRGPLPTTGILVGGGLFVLACTAYIHLFLIKLIRSADDRRARERRRQVDARLMRELSRSERRASRERA